MIQNEDLMPMNIWLVVSTPLKKYEFVSWADYSQYMEMFQTTNQLSISISPTNTGGSNI